MNKNIILVGIAAIGLYLFSQAKKIPFITGVQRRRPSATTPTIRQRTAQKIAQKVAQKVAQRAAQKVAPKRIGQPTTQAARIAALRKAAVRKAAAQKIGKKIGKMVAQKIPLNVKTRRAVIAHYAKRQRPQIQRPRPTKKQVASRLFPGAEKSRIIPYSESSRHSYYGSKTLKLQNEGYGKGKAERDKKEALEFRLNELRTLFPESDL